MLSADTSGLAQGEPLCSRHFTPGRGEVFLDFVQSTVSRFFAALT